MRLQRRDADQSKDPLKPRGAALAAYCHHLSKSRPGASMAELDVEARTSRVVDANGRILAAGADAAQWYRMPYLHHQRTKDYRRGSVGLHHSYPTAATFDDASE